MKTNENTTTGLLGCSVCGMYLAVVTSGPNMGLYYAVADGMIDEGFWCRTKFTDHTPQMWYT